MGPLSRRAEVLAALGLADTDGVGPVRFRRLVDRFGSARRAVAEGRSAARGDSLPRDLAAAARARPAPAARLEELESAGVRAVAYGQTGYPERLRHLHRPPPVLYLQGRGGLPDGRAVGVVGTRKATGYGRRMARDLASGLARAGWTVVSGMAAGIDGAAHRASLDAEGATVGVLGSGLDHEYPAANRDLYRKMRRDGLLATEFAPSTRPEPGLFPRRNRLIAALADGVVVVQAGRKSGALITVEHALELGREVFAIPGPVGPAASEGVHGLLRDGAVPVTCAGDVLEALEGESRAGGAAAEDGDGRGGERGIPSRDRLAAVFGSDAGTAEAVCRALREGPRHADDLAVEIGLEAGAAAALLGRMELEGWIRGLPGGRFAPPPR